jgi:hypothetical protein
MFFPIAIALAFAAKPILAKDPSHGDDKSRQRSEFTVTKKVDKTSAKTATNSSTSAGTGASTGRQTKKAKTSGGVLNTKAIHKPQPAYPPIAP